MPMVPLNVLAVSNAVSSSTDPFFAASITTSSRRFVALYLRSVTASAAVTSSRSSVSFSTWASSAVTCFFARSSSYVAVRSCTQRQAHAS